jgi:hypothetical protein
MTFILLKLLDKVMGLRVSPEEEAAGLDISLHGEVTPYRHRSEQEWLPRSSPRPAGGASTGAADAS